MKFRKKPVVIDAWEIVLNDANCPVWVEQAFFALELLFEFNGEYSLSVKTLEGVMKAQLGDMLIRGVRGELYPCKREIFLETYEPVT